MQTSPAQFLLQSLLADALLLNEWGSRPLADDTNSDDTPPPSAEPLLPCLSFKELRRRRNRVYMQQARHKQRETVASMRQTLTLLSTQFERLQEAKSHASTCVAEFTALAETSHRLKAEKFHLQRLLVEHEKLRLRLQEDLRDCEWLMEDECALAEPAATFFECGVVSQARAQAAIRVAGRRLAQFELNARPLADWFSEADEGPTKTFGWAVTCEISSKATFFLCMTKRLAGVSAQDALRRTWASMGRPRQTDKSPSLRIVRSELLQQLDSSTVVVANDWHHPVKRGIRMRSLSVRCCLATERGFALGLGTLNPQIPELRKQFSPPGVEYFDASSWHDFADDDSGGCFVTLKTLFQYDEDTNENTKFRLVNALCSTWRWETEVTQRPMRMLA